MNIEELVEKARQGDENAMESLCRQFAGLMKKTANQQHLRLIDEDALSVAYSGFVEAVKEYEPNRCIPFAGYAKSKVQFAVWNFFKQERKRWQSELSMESQADTGLISDLADKINIEQEIEIKLSLCNLIEIIKTLPKKQQQVIIYTVFFEQNLVQTAKCLGITPQAVYALKQRAINFMKKHKDLAH